MRPKLKRFYFGGQLVTETFFDRFWKKVNKPNTPNSECWIWTGMTNQDGYGVISTGIYKTAAIQTHRLSWILHFGNIPEGLCVCHACDVRICVRPEHLWLGTILENNQDMKRKGRYNNLKGEQLPQHKLTEESVREIRKIYSFGTRSQNEIAIQYGVSRRTIGHIIARACWNHVV